MRDTVGVDRDHADRALARERAELLLDAARRQSEAALLRHLDGDKVAVLGAIGRARRDRDLAPELLLVDRREPAGAVGQRAENAEHALLDAVDDLDDASAVADGVGLLAGFLDAQQRAVADAGDLVWPRAPRHRDVDFRRPAVRLFVPFRRRGDELTVGIAPGDVGE